MKLKKLPLYIAIASIPTVFLLALVLIINPNS